jgi:hypothetical protein
MSPEVEKCCSCVEPNAAKRVMFRGGHKFVPFSGWQKISDMANKRRTTELNQQIDDNLRRVYADAAKEPVPERFTKLLEQLRMHAAERPSEPPEEKS